MDARERKWTTVNQPPVVPIQHQDPEAFHGDFSNEQTDLMASPYRSVILKAAGNIAANYRKQTLKRKPDEETQTASKRTKVGGAFNSHARSKTSKNFENAAVRLCISMQAPECEPVKRYLQPITQSKLNEIPGAQIVKAEVSVRQQQVSSGIPSRTKNRKDASKEQSGRTVARPFENKGLCSEAGDPEQSMMTSQTFDSEDVGVRLDLDLDDAFFDTSDREFLTPKIPPNNVLEPSKRSAPQTNHGKEDSLSSSPFSLIQQTYSSSPYLPSKILPFLRYEAAEPLPTIKYSAIPRLTPSLRIQTCFRIAEALRILRNQPSPGTPQPKVTIELYTIITSTPASINSNKQTIRLADIFFPNQPPYLEGTLKTPMPSLAPKPTIHTITATTTTTTTTSSSSSSSSSSSNTSSSNQHYNPKIHRAIIHPTTTTTTSNNPLKHIPTTQSKQPQPPISQVTIESLRETNWDEIDYVRGIVDPKGLELDRQKQKSRQR